MPLQSSDSRFMVVLMSDQNDEMMYCAVCGEEMDPEVDRDKWDPDAIVYADDMAYHKRCEGDIFEEVFARA